MRTLRSAFMLVALLLQLACASSANPKSLPRLELVAIDGAVDSLSGIYRNPSHELVEHIGGVTELDELHLFPDGRYLYCEWADVQPWTVYDRGRWSSTAGEVWLVSDPAITWKPSLSRRLLAFRRSTSGSEALLVDSPLQLAAYEESLVKHEDPEFRLLLDARIREGRYRSGERARRDFEELLRDRWHPENVGGE